MGNAVEQQRSISHETGQRKQRSPIDLPPRLDDNGGSKERVVNHDSASGIYSNDSISCLSSNGSCSLQNISCIGTSGEQNEAGDCGPWRQVSEELFCFVLRKRKIKLHNV